MRLLPAFAMCLALGIAAGAQPPGAANAESPPEAAKRAAAERFHARHPTKGRSTKDVVQRMRAEGFRCALEFRSEVPEFEPRPRALRDGRVAVVFCSKWDPGPGLDCIEERVSFDIDLHGAQGDAETLRARVERAPVVGQSYICVPARGRAGVDEGPRD